MSYINGSPGYLTPDSQLEGILPVHPTAARRPHCITVQSENTLYDDDHITSKFYNRGASVSVTDGQFVVVPKAEEYQFRTKRNVSKTGLVFDCCFHFSC
jgi:myo-inositol-1-phosphate synthase